MSYLIRVARSDVFRRGVATGVAGILVSAIIEGLWPTSSPQS